MPQPDEAAVMQMGEDGGDGAIAACYGSRFSSGQFCAPGLRVEMREQKLVHVIVNRVDLKQDIADLD